MKNSSRPSGFKVLFGIPIILVLFSQVAFVQNGSTQDNQPASRFFYGNEETLQESETDYGPWNGKLNHQAGKVVWFEPKVNLKDFTAQVTFYNPHSVEKGGWDYGIAFRGNSGNWMLLSVTSNSDWKLQCTKSGKTTYPGSGVLSNLDINSNGKNKLKFSATGSQGALYVNDQFVSALDISCSDYSGDVSLFTGYFMPGISGEVTRFSEFTIKENPAQRTVGNGSSSTTNLRNDSDKDGIDDATELRIARKYSPVLEFDEHETEEVSDTVVSLYQVSPITRSNGKEGAILTFVFLYDGDYGADFDQGWKDWFTDPIDTIAGVIMDPFDQFFGKHCGDTEVIYLYIQKNGNWENTRLESIYWKRHYDPIYQTSESIVDYEDIGDGFGRTHPVIYVSEDKHGMYPSHKACEKYETDVVEERIRGAIKIKIPLTPKMEDCSDGDRLNFKNLSHLLNVGEAISEETMNRAALNGTIYAGYDPWENVDFWGRTDYEKLCVDPAGGLGGKWCGNPFSTGQDHPCNSKDWFGNKNSSGKCMNINTDRFGSDFANFSIESNSAEPCAYACFFNNNCVSYAYVLPVKGSTRGICYLKNYSPKPFSKEGVVSGLSDDCYSMNWVPPGD